MSVSASDFDPERLSDEETQRLFTPADSFMQMPPNVGDDDHVRRMHSLQQAMSCLDDDQREGLAWVVNDLANVRAQRSIDVVLAEITDLTKDLPAMIRLNGLEDPESVASDISNDFDNAVSEAENVRTKMLGCW